MDVVEDQGAPGVVEGNAEYAVVQGVFATGFSVPGRTIPGFAVRCDKVNVTFEGVSVSGGVNLVAEGLETFYDWCDIMELVSTAVQDQGSMDDVEDTISEALTDWLTSLSGWGLLSTLMPVEKTRHIIAALLYTNANWNESTGGPRTDLKVFEAVKYVYNHVPGRSVHDLVPRIGVWFQELRPSAKTQERKKRLVVYFKGQWDVQVKFIVEKKRVIGETLTELASEAVANQVWRLHHLDTKRLELADTLQAALDRYFHDAQWVRKHWDLDVDFDTDSEGDATFGKYLSSDSFEKEESPVESACLQPCEQQPVQDEEDERADGGAQDASEKDCEVSSEEADILAKEQQDGNLDDEEETNHVAEHEEVSMELREPDFTDRWEAMWWALYFFSLLLAFLCF